MRTKSICMILIFALAAVSVCIVGNADAKKDKKFVDEGLASWYGKEWQGKRTASGERFDMHEFTAAHKTLPFGTVVEVKNLTNNKKVRVRINDRGPFARGRIIDLTYAAAKKIDMLDAGVVKVRIEVVDLD